MKRLALVAVAAALFASTAAIAVADDTDVDTETSETRELSEAQLLKAKLLADYSIDGDADQEAVDEIVDLRTGDTVIGWGAMFKLLQLAKATEMSLSELLATIDGDGDGDDDGWAFGRRFRELGLNPGKPLEDAPKNLGQLKKQNRGPKGSQGKKP